MNGNRNTRVGERGQWRRGRILTFDFPEIGSNTRVYTETIRQLSRVDPVSRIAGAALGYAPRPFDTPVGNAEDAKEVGGRRGKDILFRGQQTGGRLPEASKSVAPPRLVCYDQRHLYFQRGA